LFADESDGLWKARRWTAAGIRLLILPFEKRGESVSEAFGYG
jgi:hypothetical protein